MFKLGSGLPEEREVKTKPTSPSAAAFGRQKRGQSDDTTEWPLCSPHRHSTGSGHLYQGRFKSFPIQEDEHFQTVCRYVERNALRAGLVDRAEDWQWGSLWRTTHGDDAARAILSPWPVRRPPDWRRYVNRPQTVGELDAIRRAIVRGSPYGGPRWTKRVATELGLETTLRPRGRPKKGS